MILKGDRMIRKVALQIAILMMLLAGCSTGDQTAMIENVAPTATTTPQPTRTSPPTIKERVTITPGMDGALTIEEHPFTHGEDYESVLAQYEDAEWLTVSSRSSSVEIDGTVITWRDQVTPEDENLEEAFLKHIEVVLYRDGEQFLTIPIGTIKAGSIVYGIYSDGDSWYLEVDRGEAYYLEDGSLMSTYQGDIYSDGVSLNEKEGYDECFGFSILKGKPFYFFVRDGAYYYHFDGVDYSLDYTYIIHHMCCSGSMAEPRGFEDGVVFFADRDIQRYLVIIGE